MKAIVHLLFCCAVFSILACGGDNSFMVQLRHLDSLLIEHPDSVYQVLEGMEKESRAQSEASRMYYALLRADAQNKAYIDFTTDSVMLQVADYYDLHGTANEQMRAHYLLGCTYPTSTMFQWNCNASKKPQRRLILRRRIAISIHSMPSMDRWQRYMTISFFQMKN